MPVDIGVYLPQVGLAWDDLRARVVACDRLGIHSVWFMDHLYPPGLPKVPSFEAWTTAAALAAVTELGEEEADLVAVAGGQVVVELHHRGACTTTARREESALLPSWKGWRRSSEH